MTNNLKEEIKNLCASKNPFRYNSIKNNEIYMNWIEENYPSSEFGNFFENRYKISYMIIHEMKKEPKCKNCDNNTNFRKNEFKDVCSYDCYTAYSTKSGLRKKIHEKAKKTWLEKYGVENLSQNKEFKDKAIKTMMEKYGGNTLQSPILKEKVAKTNLERYGNTCVLQNPEIRKKADKTLLEKYGTTIPLHNDFIKNKSKSSIIEKYGVDNVSKSPYIKNKKRETTFENYGVYEIAHKNMSPKTVEYLTNIDKLQELVNEFGIVHVAKKLKVSMGTIYRRQSSGLVIPYLGKSSYEIELYEILSKYNINIDCNNRTILEGHELDFYFPDNNFALEINGVYWHSEIGGGKSRSYHHDKWKKCNDLGITLLSLYDVEYDVKPEFWINKILYQLGKIEVQKIYARKCEVREISDKKIIYEFLENNHLQGKTQFSKGIGLYYNDELISVMTFGNNKKDVVDLNRFCSRLDIQVIGGASKLLQYFIKNYGSYYKEIVSFSDNRYSNGKVYETLGFELVKELKPDYQYNIHGRELFHKANFRKSSIQSKFNLDPEYVSSKTEWELMQELGYDRIWDCGKKKWSMKI